MSISIRNSIKNNFKNNSIEDIRKSIEESVNDEDEVILPGLGVFFEILWNNSDEECRSKMLRLLESSLQ